jgi:hypothetical protein
MSQVRDQDFTFFASRACNESYFCTQSRIHRHGASIINGLVIRVGMNEKKAKTLIVRAH